MLVAGIVAHVLEQLDAFAKYTLACLDAAAFDPARRNLCLAAAAYLHAWWAPT